MTAQILSSELGHLIQESKRKNQELKQAAESSLSDLKALPTTSEKQISSDLSRRTQFINPFLLACSSKNVKHAGIGMSCLQRLAAAHALPKSRLKDVLDAITECSTLAFDIQLKILQTLPTLLQNYGDQINGTNFFTTIQICSTLQASRTPSISSTSAATLQQLIASLYDKLSREDQRALELPTTATVSVGKQDIQVRTVAHDAYRFFHDLCLLISGEKPQVVGFAPTSEPALLELIESILTGNAKIIDTHVEQAYVVKTLLLPYLLKGFSQRLTFPVFVRSTRVLYLIIKNHLELFPEEVEIVMRGLLQGLDQDTTILWKRTLFMEVFREIFTDSQLVLKIHMQLNKQPKTRPIIPECLASFVRLATERPAIIGLGQHSTVPIGNYFQRESAGEQPDASMAAAGSAGVPTAAVPGISIQFSHTRTPCIEQLDKAEAPTTPETYVYSLVLACLNNLAESLSRFILPLATQATDRGKRQRQNTLDESSGSGNDAKREQTSEQVRLFRKKTIVVNPLHLQEHPAFEGVKAVENLIDTAWHAILACCSTFFHAALDTENYRSLVRSFQKYSQIAGLLQMEVPRDAFLTTLGKNAMPPNLVTATIPSAASQTPQTPSSLNNIKDFLNVENIVNQASSFLPERRRHSVDDNDPALNVRNLLCLRALLNLAIALGPLLASSWTIIFETLQQADRVLANPTGRSGRTSSSAQLSNNSLDGPAAVQQISSEAAAVQSATSRLIESTAELPNEAFTTMLRCLCALVHKETLNGTLSAAASPPQTPSHKRRLASFSGLSVKTGVQEHDFLFVLTKLRELATLNMNRFVITSDEGASGWSLLLEETTIIATNPELPATARLLSVDLIRKLVVDTISLCSDLSGDVESAAIYARALTPLRSVANSFRRNNSENSAGAGDETAIEAHSIVLHSLKNILEQIGDSLVDGWISVLDVIASSFEHSQVTGDDINDDTQRLPELISANLGHAAFGSLQLICSDFLTPNLDPVFPALIDLLYQFNAQEQDLNMSLTTTNFFWNVSDFLYTRVNQQVLDEFAALKSFNIIDALHSHSGSSTEQSVAVIWLYLVQQMSKLVTDNRDEVRNSAIHTIVRIFDNNGEDLSPDVWQLCLDSILLPMLSLDMQSYSHFQIDGGWLASSHNINALKSKIGTSQVLLSALGRLIADFLGPITSAPNFPMFWDAFTDCMISYLGYDLHDINSSVFETLHIVLSRASASTFSPSALAKATDIWDKHPPKYNSALASSSNVKAFESYATALMSNYDLRRTAITLVDTEKILGNLKGCIRHSEASAYSHDLDSMTTLQKMVMKAISSLRTDIDHTTAAIIKTLSYFIGLPIEVAAGEQPSGQTFIALSKASMEAMEQIVTRDCAWSELFDSGALQLALENLEGSIRLKYYWQRQGRSPALWQRATSAALLVLKQAVPRLSSHEMDIGKLRQLWESIVQVVYHIANADHVDEKAAVTEQLLRDELFDMDALQKLSSLITVPLGTSELPDALRRSYTRALFLASLIHPYRKLDLPDLEKSPLDGLYRIRYGRTVATPPRARQHMSYLCFSILLDLLAQKQSEQEQIRLAKAAAPYVILRAALPLRSYIADQPLRGDMPVPMSLRKELITVLDKLCDLRCEPCAIPATVNEDGVGGSGAHLVRLYPLIRGAVAVGGPAQIRDALNRWLQMMEKEIGLESI